MRDPGTRGSGGGVAWFSVGADCKEWPWCLGALLRPVGSGAVAPPAYSLGAPTEHRARGSYRTRALACVGCIALRQLCCVTPSARNVRVRKSLASPALAAMQLMRVPRIGERGGGRIRNSA